MLQAEITSGVDRRHEAASQAEAIGGSEETVAAKVAARMAKVVEEDRVMGTAPSALALG
jgi:hypothetical protein